MDLFWAVVFLVVGLALLAKCADFLVVGAVGLAERLGVSSLVIGLTVVAMGTSAPEVAASVAAAVRRIGDVAIGNVYGSNIANLALVGGLAALIRPTRVPASTTRREIPIMIATALLLWPVLADGYLSRAESAGLLLVFAVLLAGTIWLAKGQGRNKGGLPPEIGDKILKIPAKTTTSIVLILAGLAGLAVGADITVRGAIFLGRAVGLSEAVIGLTIIAIGTSLPELATCIVASAKGHYDLSVGNLVGSNIFNTLLVVGVAGTVRPFAVAERLIGLDYWIMIAVSAAFAALVIIGKRVITRAAGVVLLAGYVIYLLYLFSWTPGQ